LSHPVESVFPVLFVNMTPDLAMNYFTAEPIVSVDI